MPQEEKGVDNFRLVLSPRSVKDLDKLSDTALRKITKALRVLEENPFPRGTLIRKIKGRKSNYYRLRTDKYRVFYLIKGGDVVVLRVIDKKDTQKFIQGLR